MGVPTGVINGFDFVAMDIHKSLACEKKGERRREREREEGEGGREGEKDETAATVFLLSDLGPAAGPKDVKHEKKAERAERASGEKIGIHPSVVDSSSILKKKGRKIVNYIRYIQHHLYIQLHIHVHIYIYALESIATEDRYNDRPIRLGTRSPPWPTSADTIIAQRGCPAH